MGTGVTRPGMGPERVCAADWTGNPVVVTSGSVRGALNDGVLQRWRLTPAVEDRGACRGMDPGQETWSAALSAMRSRMPRTRPVDSIPTPVVGLLGALLGLTLLAFWFDQHASVSVAHRADPLVVVIRHEGDQVTFEAYEHGGRLWSAPGVARPVSTLLVTAHGDALWQVETVTPQVGPITYGRVPEGFVQMIPGTGPPPALQAAEEYGVSVVGPAGTGRARFTFPPPPRGPR
jgi:hypothetical protein